MKTRNYKSQRGLIRQTWNDQLNLVEFKRGYFYHKKMRENVKFNLSDDVREKIYAEIEKLIFGEVNGLVRYYRGNMYGILTRIIIHEDRITYCAGQEYTSEMRNLRKIFRNG